jgi:hypothetical protein
MMSRHRNGRWMIVHLMPRHDSSEAALATSPEPWDGELSLLIKMVGVLSWDLQGRVQAHCRGSNMLLNFVTGHRKVLSPELTGQFSEIV